MVAINFERKNFEEAEAVTVDCTVAMVMNMMS